MGIGDQLLGSGMARGAHARGKRVAFGNGSRIIWDQHSELIFRGNPNVATPGTERQRDIEWCHYYKGHRLYNRHDREGDRWVWNYDFRAQPGEVFFSAQETRQGARCGEGFIIIEPDVVTWKSSAINKDWGRANYQEVANRLKADGERLIQFGYEKGGPALDGVERVVTMGFRDALAIMAHAKMFVGPEGGLHHGAAAVGIPAVVLFGGFIPPEVTGYATHKNLTGGAEACGSLHACAHCRQAMARISVDEVVEAVRDMAEWT